MLSGPNAIRADRLTAEERLTEIGEMLAAALLRVRNREVSLVPERTPAGGPICLGAEVACSAKVQSNTGSETSDTSKPRLEKG